MKGKHLMDKEWAAALIPAAFVSFTFCIFGPIEIYISNISELWFSINDVLWPSILVGIISFGILFLIGILLPGAMRKWYSCVLIGLGVALYVQGNFIRTSYGVLDGNEIQWDAYGSVAIWDTAIWIVCLALPFVAQRALKDRFKSTSAAVLCCILTVQVITLGTLGITTDFSKSQDGDTTYLSDKNLYTVSTEKNVVVFVLDTFDQQYLDEVLNEQPDILDLWDGFSYYTNATCEYPTTIGSLPFMLTGQYYKNEQPYSDYVEEAYQNTDFYEKLHEAGYGINLYTSESYVSNDMKQRLVENAEKGKVSVNSHIELEKSMLQFAAFRYFPHIAKRFVWFYSGIFDQYKDSTGETVPYSTDNISFYSGLKANGLQTISGKSIYSFIHLDGVHPPFTLNKDVTIAEGTAATSTTQGIACLNIVSEYIAQLKKLDIYDNTMIIVTADHGSTVGVGQWPIFLMKGFGRSGTVNSSSAPISHANLIPSIMEENGLNDGDKYGKPIEKISDSDTGERKYYYYNWAGPCDKDYLPVMTEYMVDAEKTLAQTGNVFTSQGIETFVPYEYQIGEDIVFTENESGDGTRYFTNGISLVEIDFAWSLGKTGQMILIVGEQTEDLISEFQFKGLYAPPQRFIVRCGDLVLFDKEILSAETPVSFVIPTNCIKDGRIVLNLEYPDAISPYNYDGAADERELAFRFYKIRFYSAEDQKGDLSYQLGSDIVFSANDNGCRYFSSGISYVETDFAWSLGNSGQMRLYIEENKGDLTGEFLFKRLYTPPQRFTIHCDGLLLFNEEISSIEEPIRFTIPENCIKGGWMTLDLEYPDAVSPKSLGQSEDGRILAFGFKSIRFYPTEE